jgi:hypothetical protein
VVRSYIRGIGVSPNSKGLTVQNEQNVNEATENPANDQTTEGEEGKTDGGEFKLTVRKLEMPVRPRGVLAE